MTRAMIFSGDETCDLGRDSATCVSPDYAVNDNAFTGRVDSERIDLGDDSHAHLIRP